LGRAAQPGNLFCQRGAAFWRVAFPFISLEHRVRFHSQFHALSDTFASHQAMKGVSLYFIQKILGHASIETTTRTYAHLQPDPLAHAVKELDY
jgi:integrase